MLQWIEGRGALKWDLEDNLTTEQLLRSNQGSLSCIKIFIRFIMYQNYDFVKITAFMNNHQKEQYISEIRR